MSRPSWGTTTSANPIQNAKMKLLRANRVRDAEAARAARAEMEFYKLERAIDLSGPELTPEQRRILSERLLTSDWADLI